MPFYDFVCPNCGHLQEELQGMNDARSATCEMCGSLSRWSATTLNGLTIVGDTCSGNTNYAQYDPILGVELRGKSHRREEMAKQNLREYEPNPGTKAAKDEARYIRSHAEPGDKSAAAASRAVVEKAQDGVTKARIKERVDKTMSKMDISV